MITVAVITYWESENVIPIVFLSHELKLFNYF